MTLHALLVNLVIVLLSAGIFLEFIGLLACNLLLRQWSARLIAGGLLLAIGAVWSGLHTARQFPDMPPADAAALARHRLWGLVTATSVAGYLGVRFFVARLGKLTRSSRLLLVFLALLAGSALFQTVIRGSEAGRLFRKYVEKQKLVSPKSRERGTFR